MLSGFPSLGGGDEDSQEDMDTAEASKMVQDMNRKKKKSGGFQVRYRKSSTVQRLEYNQLLNFFQLSRQQFLDYRHLKSQSKRRVL